MEETIKVPACAAPDQVAEPAAPGAPGYDQRTNRLEKLATILPRLMPALGEGPILEAADRFEPQELSVELEAGRERAALAVLRAIERIAGEDRP